MKNLLTLITGLVIFTFISNAQGVAINTDGTAANASAILDIKSGNKGVLFPRFKRGDRDFSITSPVAGLIIYQTDENPGFYYYDGSTWKPVQDQLGDHNMTQNLKTNNFYISGTGSNTGIQVKDSGRINIYGLNPNGGPVSQTGAIDPNGGLYLQGNSFVGTLPVSGAGVRMLWYPSKESFRAGMVIGTQWDDVNIGDYSFATGNSCIASNLGTFSGGDGCIASGTVAFTYGSGNASSGPASTSIGAACTAAGFGSTAIGYGNRALGQGSVALGYRTSATGDYDIALGYRATSNGFDGCMVMGDNSVVDSVRNTAYNQFAARYAGGYRFYTNSSTTIGVSLTAGGNSWSSISDSTKKENFVYVNEESFLNKLVNLKLGSWNYKGQMAKNYRHYGPMAQEIFAAYGKDKYGKIGCDTLLAGADMDGIIMILLQGLEKRTAIQKEDNALLTAELTKIKAQLNDLADENKKLKADIARINTLQEQVIAMQQKLEGVSSSATAHKEINKMPVNVALNK